MNIKNKVTVIAEVGPNHNGNIKLAKKLILESKKIGADYVKFQISNPDEHISSLAKLAPYQKNKKFTNQLEMVKSFVLSQSTYIRLNNYAKKYKIKFLLSPFDISSIDFIVKELKLNLIKIPSGEINNFIFLRHLAKFNLNIILSTGMSTLSEIKACIKILTKFGTNRNKITILHCNSAYPTPIEDLNLNCIDALKKEFGKNIGFSDHSLDIYAPIIAVTKGARIIEKHITLDKKSKGPDHKASLTPDEFKKMIFYIRSTETALGTSKINITKSEIKNLKYVRKSIVAKCGIHKDEVFTEENLTVKRPFNGISPMQWNKIIGRRAIKSFIKDEPIKI